MDHFSEFLFVYREGRLWPKIHYYEPYEFTFITLWSKNFDVTHYELFWLLLGQIGFKFVISRNFATSLLNLLKLIWEIENENGRPLNWLRLDTWLVPFLIPCCWKQIYYWRSAKRFKLNSDLWLFIGYLRGLNFSALFRNTHFEFFWLLLDLVWSRLATVKISRWVVGDLLEPKWRMLE